MSWRSIQINQFSSCAFCVENDFESTTSWKSILHLSTQSIPLLCILCGKWFWINATITWGTILHLSTQSIHNTSLSPSFSFTSGVSLSSPPAPPGGLDWQPMWRNISMTFLVSYFSREEEHIVVFVENFFQHMAVRWAQTNHLWDPGSGGWAYALARSDGDKAKTS